MLCFCCAVSQALSHILIRHFPFFLFFLSFFFVYLARQTHKAMQKMRQKNEVTMQLKGELSAEREEQTDQEQRNYDKMLQNAATLADLLDVDLPELPEEEPDAYMSTVNIDLSNPFKDAEVKRVKERRIE